MRIDTEHRLAGVLLAALAIATAATAVGTTTTVALSGQQAPGTPNGAAFRSFGSVVLNAGAQVAFGATLATGTGGVTSSNDTGIWRGTTPIAREGSQAPGHPPTPCSRRSPTRSS